MIFVSLHNGQEGQLTLG